MKKIKNKNTNIKVTMIIKIQIKQNKIYIQKEFTNQHQKSNTDIK